MNFDKQLWFVGKLGSYVVIIVAAAYFLLRVALTFTLGMHTDLAFPLTILVGLAGALGIGKLASLMITDLFNHFNSFFN